MDAQLTREEIAAHNREKAPNAVELAGEWLTALKQVFPRARLMHAVDHETQYEVGRAQADHLNKNDMLARRCDGAQ